MALHIPIVHNVGPQWVPRRSARSRTERGLRGLPKTERPPTLVEGVGFLRGNGHENGENPGKTPIKSFHENGEGLENPGVAHVSWIRGKTNV